MKRFAAVLLLAAVTCTAQVPLNTPVTKGAVTVQVFGWTTGGQGDPFGAGPEQNGVYLMVSSASSTADAFRVVIEGTIVNGQTFSRTVIIDRSVRLIGNMSADSIFLPARLVSVTSLVVSELTIGNKESF